MSPASVLAALTLVVGVPLNVYVTWRLWRLHRAAPQVGVLTERWIVETFVLLVVIVFGLIFLNNDAALPLIGGDLTKLITRAAVLALATIPALRWLWMYRKA